MMAAFNVGGALWESAGFPNILLLASECIAKYGSPDATYTAPAVKETATATHVAGAATHTVIVAPTQG